MYCKIMDVGVAIASIKRILKKIDIYICRRWKSTGTSPWILGNTVMS